MRFPLRGRRETEDKVPGGISVAIIQIIVSVLIPPLGVFLKRGLGWSFVLSILLTLLGYIPGLIYALYVVVLRD